MILSKIHEPTEKSKLFPHKTVRTVKSSAYDYVYKKYTAENECIGRVQELVEETI